MIDTIIFDYGGVIGSDAHNILFDACVNHGMNIDEAKKIWAKHWLSMEIGKQDAKDIWKSISEKIELGNIIEEYESSISYNPKVIEVCKELKKKGYKMGVLANECKAWFKIKVQKAGLQEIFDVLVVSADIGIKKPKKEAFLRTLNSLNAKPTETLFVDNQIENIEAAKELCMQTIHYINPEQLKQDLLKLKM